ncbi:MAG: tripartite tricarboxylate transporter permease [Candidatus Pacearchaeota archaeon]
MLAILIAIMLGIFAGIITGLIPGIHINLVALLLFIFSTFFLKLTTPFVLACFIVAMSITHSFLDFIPSIFLGAPNEKTALSVLPGHRMLLKGQGFNAVKLTTIGCFLGTLIACSLAFFFATTANFFYPYLHKTMAFILIAISFLLIMKENKKVEALFVFLFAGLLGFTTLNFKAIKQPLFPLFTGLFGSSLLAISFLQNVSLPKQKDKKIKLKKQEITTSFWSSILSSSLVSFLPGIGAAQAATISSSLKKMSERAFLILLGMISTMTMIFSFVALYAIKKPRTGVAVFVGKFLPELTMTQLLTLLVVALIAASICVFISLFLAKFFSKNITKIKYKWLCFGILLFLIAMTPLISGWLALIVLIAGTSLGILTSVLGVKKIHMMGSLLLPVILWYLL